MSGKVREFDNGWRVASLQDTGAHTQKPSGFYWGKPIYNDPPQIQSIFYAPQLYRQVLLWRVLAVGILSVCPSVCLSRPGGIPRPGEIETPGLHNMIA